MTIVIHDHELHYHLAYHPAMRIATRDVYHDHLPSSVLAALALSRGLKDPKAFRRLSTAGMVATKKQIFLDPNDPSTIKYILQ